MRTPADLPALAATDELAVVRATLDYDANGRVDVTTAPDGLTTLFPTAAVPSREDTVKMAAVGAEAVQRLAGQLEAVCSDGSSDAVRDRMYDFDALNAVIGTPEMLALGKTYADDQT